MSQPEISPDQIQDKTNPNSKDRVALSQLRFFWPYIRPYRNRIYLAAFILVAVSFALLLLGRGLAFLVDRGLGQGDPALLNRAVIVTFIVGLFIAVGSYLRMSITNDVAERVMADIRHAIFAHILNLPIAWFETAKIGDVISRLNTDTSVVQGVLASTLSMAVRNVILLVGGLILVVLSSAKMSLVVAIIVPIVVLPLFILRRRLRAASDGALAGLGDLAGEAEEGLSAIRTVHAFSQEDYILSRFDSRLKASLDAALKQVRLRSALTGFIFFMMVTGVATILWVGGQDLLAGGISAGDLSAFIFYAFIVASSTGNLSELGGDLQRAAGAAQRISDLLQIPARPADPLVAKNPPIKSQDRTGGVDIHFDQVRFAYPSRPDQPALDKINFTAKKGQKIAIVGPSGAGKSTLFHLLLRFYQLDSGQIRLDDVDIAKMNLSTLRGRIAIVPQDVVLFSASLADNIAFGSPQAERPAIIAAAIQAEADSFINVLPDGYETQVGAKGVRLSGGQRQRIAIARAILRDPDILLLDEATNALDFVSESAIQFALAGLMRGRTSLVIAHRFSTIIDADQIIVMNNGQIDAIGEHEGLMASSELYRRLAAQQFA